MHQISCVAAMILGSILLSSQSASAQPKQQATLRLDWLASGYQAPFFLALDRGYYRDQGIELEIADGKGSNTTIQVVASGAESFGFANLSATALGIGRGLPVMAIACIIQKSPDSIISLLGSGIQQPKDIQGKRGAFSPTGATDRIFPAFAKLAGIDMSKVTRIQIESSARYSVLLQGNADFVVGWSFDDGYKIGKQRPIEPPILFSDNGVNTLSAGLITSKEMLATRPDLVRGFLVATIRGLQETIKSPGDAVEAMRKKRPNADRDALLAAAQALGSFVHTPNSAAQPLGLMAKEDWEETRRILVDYLGMSGAIPVDALYTNELLPRSKL